jgi:hypothetical protein
MPQHALDSVTRQTADPVSQRRALLALGGAALAARLAAPIDALAKSRKGKDRCKSQVGKCRGGVAELCQAIFTEDATECIELFTPCCRFLDTCQTAQAFACAVEVINENPS